MFFHNGHYVFIPLEGQTLLTVLKFIGKHVSRFCYHEILAVAGNCRACLVEIENFDKPVAACVAELESGQSIWTESLFAKKARENVFEILLINHPLDCPICDQAGECDLQDQSRVFGNSTSRYFFKKRSVFDKNCDFLIKTIMNRCIHCIRCVKFNSLSWGFSLTIFIGNNSTLWWDCVLFLFIILVIEGVLEYLQKTTFYKSDYNDELIFSFFGLYLLVFIACQIVTNPILFSIFISVRFLIFIISLVFFNRFSKEKLDKIELIFAFRTAVCVKIIFAILTS